MVVQGLRKSATGGSLISTPPAWTGAFAGLPGTRHLGAADPLRALDPSQPSEFWSENAALECRIYTPHVPAQSTWYLVLTSVRDMAKIYDHNMVVFYRFQLKHSLNCNHIGHITLTGQHKRRVSVGSQNSTMASCSE